MMESLFCGTCGLTEGLQFVSDEFYCFSHSTSPFCVVISKVMLNPVQTGLYWDLSTCTSLYSGNGKHASLHPVIF
jgi:hypothetical protein